MKIRKIMAALLAAAAVSLTACGSNNTPEETIPPTPTITESEAPAETPAPEDTAADDNAAEDDNADLDSAEEDVPMADFAEGDNPLRPLVEAAIGTGEWPFLMEVTDKEIISVFFGIDPDTESFEQTIYMQCPMSANMTEIIIIKSSDVSSAKAALEARQKKAQDMDAFYPDDIVRAGASIVGTEGDYAYFIMADDSPAAETAIVEAIKKL